jgi:hypothetical protein
MLWVGMGRHRSMLMVMVWVWVQIRRKLGSDTDIYTYRQYMHTDNIYMQLHAVETVRSEGEGAALTWVPKWVLACSGGWADNKQQQ